MERPAQEAGRLLDEVYQRRPDRAETDQAVTGDGRAPAGGATSPLLIAAFVDVCIELRLINGA